MPSTPLCLASARVLLPLPPKMKVLLRPTWKEDPAEMLILPFAVEACYLLCLCSFSLFFFISYDAFFNSQQLSSDSWTCCYFGRLKSWGLDERGFDCLENTMPHGGWKSPSVSFLCKARSFLVMVCLIPVPRLQLCSQSPPTVHSLAWLWLGSAYTYPYTSFLFLLSERIAF